jgi:predicted transposase YdaD
LIDGGTEGQTDMTKLPVALCNFANTLERRMEEGKKEGRVVGRKNGRENGSIIAKYINKNMLLKLLLPEVTHINHSKTTRLQLMCIIHKNSVTLQREHNLLAIE